MFAWYSEDRLRPLRMVWLEHNYNEPRYELAKLEREMRRPRAYPRLEYCHPDGRVERDRERRQRSPMRHGWSPRSGKARPIK